MKHLVILLVAAGVALGVYSSLSKSNAVAQRQPIVIQKPKAGGVQSIVSATPFTVERPWTHA